MRGEGGIEGESYSLGGHRMRACRGEGRGRVRTQWEHLKHGQNPMLGTGSKRKRGDRRRRRADAR